MIDCLLFNVPRQIHHAYIRREQAQQYAKKNNKQTKTKTKHKSGREGTTAESTSDFYWKCEGSGISVSQMTMDMFHLL